MRDDSDVVEKKVLRCSQFCCFVSAVYTVFLFASIFSSFSSLDQRTRGYLGAVGAILSFGSSSIPGKHPRVADIGTFRFQIYVSIANAVTTVGLVLAYEGLDASSSETNPGTSRLRWTYWGALGASVLTGAQFAAWPAVQRLGASAGPGIWCGVGMITSFLWGSVVFKESLRSVPLALTALGVLASGVGLVAISQSMTDPKSDDSVRHLLEDDCRNDDEDEERTRSTGLSTSSTSSWLFEKLKPKRSDAEIGATSPMAGTTRPTSFTKPVFTKRTGSGVFFALLTGVMDGTLMTAFKAYQKNIKNNGQDVEVDAEMEVISYLFSFGCSLPLVSLTLIFLALRIQNYGSSSATTITDTAVLDDTTERENTRERNRSVRCVGAASGFLWSVGNFSSVHATLGLGQSVGFPLTQVCVTVSAVLGILGFDEIPNFNGRFLFVIASFIVLGGAFFLAFQVNL